MEAQSSDESDAVSFASEMFTFDLKDHIFTPPLSHRRGCFFFGGGDWRVHTFRNEKYVGIW